MSSLSLGEISKKIDATLIGDEDLLVKGIRESKSCKKEYICFVKDKKFLSSLSRSSGAVILEESLAHKIDFDTNLLIHSNPYLAYANLTEVFVKKYDDHNEGIESKIGQNVNVGKHSSIGKNCIISDNVTIKDNVSIYPGTHIGPNVVIHSGSVLGSDGFGFVPTDNGWQKIFFSSRRARY
jgi:UDP-3-O-[3-hydroxymyristoyl] glucosamine N-acyltransferase